MGMYGWHDNDLHAFNLTVDGTLLFGDTATDNLIIQGRVSSMTAAGAAIQITSSYAHGEGIEMRYQVTNWTGVGDSFKGMYLRAEAATNVATNKSIYGAELYGVCNNVTMGTGSLWGTLTYAYVKGASAVTINHMYAVQGELSWDASRTGACTITTAAACFRAKITGGYVADYTKIDGYVLTIGEMDGDSQTFGNGLLMQDDADMTGTSTLTTGVNINIGCTTGISIAGTTTDAIKISGYATTAAINITSGCLTSYALLVAGTTTDAIKISGTPSNSDMMLHNGATIMNGSAGVLTITETDISLAGTVGISGKMQFGGVTDWGTGATGILVDGTGYDWASQTVARVNANLNSTAAAAAYHAMSVTASQTSTNSIFGTWTELYIKGASIDLGGSSNYAAVWGNLEVSGATGVSTDDGDFMTALHGSITVETTGYTNDTQFCGCHVDSKVHTGTTNAGNGRFSAFECKKNSGYRDWDYGVYLADVTTGISLAGAMTTGISITGACASGHAISIGSFSSPLTYTGDELIEVHGRLSSATTSDPMVRLRNSALSSGAMTTGSVTTLLVQAYNVSTHNIAAFEALQAHVGIKGAATVLADLTTGLPNMRAAWFKIEDLGNDLTLTGNAACAVFAKQFNTGTTLSGDSAYLWLLSEGNSGYNLNAIIEGKDQTGSGLATNFLDIPAALPYDAANSSGTQSGKIACQIGGATKYIQCYSD